MAGRIGAHVAVVVALVCKPGTELTRNSLRQPLIELVRSRTRKCNVTTGGSQCSGSPVEVQQCNTTVPCPGEI